MRQTKELLARQMSRKEFLQVAGMAVVALFGLNNFITFIKQNHGIATHKTAVVDQSKRRGFGSSKFGV